MKCQQCNLDSEFENNCIWLLVVVLSWTELSKSFINQLYNKLCPALNFDSNIWLTVELEIAVASETLTSELISACSYKCFLAVKLIVCTYAGAYMHPPPPQPSPTHSDINTHTHHHPHSQLHTHTHTHSHTHTEKHTERPFSLLIHPWLSNNM